MKHVESFRCILVGGESLLIQCAESLLQAGHQVAVVISENERILEWAREKDIKVFKELKGVVPKLPAVDYLFSIANLRFLSKELIEFPRLGAINFHDGPLPRYAGLNTPNWALINQEKSHGITWHIMTDEVDAGDILQQRMIDIADDETAFTLNAKCYDAAFQCFEQLVSDLAAGTEQRQVQDFSSRTLYTREQRPSAACVIDWHRPAEEIDALVRALDFGTYQNILGSAKIVVDNTAYIVAKVEVVAGEGEKAPGAIVAVDDSRIVVAAQAGFIAITQLQTLQGANVSVDEIVEKYKLSAGYCFDSFSQNERECFSDYNKSIVVSEGAWVKRLSDLLLVELPIAGRPESEKSSPDFSYKRFETAGFTAIQGGEEAARGATIATMFALYLARMSGKSEFDLAFSFSGLKFEQSQFRALFSDNVPLRFTLEKGQMLASYLKRTVLEVNSALNQKGYSRDVAARYPQLRTPSHSWLQQSPRVLLCCVDEVNKEGFTATEGVCGADLALVVPDDGEECLWSYNTSVYSLSDVEVIEHQFKVLLENALANPDYAVDLIPLLSEHELQRLSQEWGAVDVATPDALCVHQAIERQVIESPDATAIAYRDEALSYSAVNEKANQIAHYLISKGIKPGSLVGVMLDRSLDLVPAMIGIWKAGGAYVPLDPAYPKDRLTYMAGDAQLALVITSSSYESYLPNQEALILDSEVETLAGQKIENPNVAVSSADLAYIIYTSGSTGKPKGVMVEHRNVINFFAGMDRSVNAEEAGVWLAVTSISFDISVLELFWPLARGFKVVIYNDADQYSEGKALSSRHPDINMDFSLFYWNIVTDQNRNEKEKYRLLMESARYGDVNGFKAVWTPERHFGSFGGIFPNPSVISAAIAVQTDQIEIRSGSCVLPLHSPIRAAEEWSVVDNLSNGRVGLGIAAGWQPNDFVIKPENHSNARDVMFESIETLKQLWRGEKVSFPAPNGGEDVVVETLPRPIQTELPIWITVAGNPETYKQAGKIGAGILTHLLGQSVEQVADNIKLYRQARKEAGHAGPGIVTLLLHTLVGDNEEEVKELARQPMKDYLLSAVFLVKAAAWHFPTFKELSDDTGQTLDEYFDTISDADLDGLLDFAFERYYSQSGLFGTAERCMEMVDRLKEIGVNEIGCLIDYGMATDKVLEHLPAVNEVRKAALLTQEARTDDYTLAGLIKRHHVTHFQCTPSMANMLVSDSYAHSALSRLSCMMVGGEAFPAALAEQLRSLVGGRVINMYGPTETTIWSSTYELDKWNGSVPLGSPIANTRIHILDQNQQLLPPGVAGEIVIAGSGVVRGYLNRPDLTSERFVDVEIAGEKSCRVYKTGDLGRIKPDGTLEFLGRIDHQVKILGYRIELGEIESVTQQHSGVESAIVLPVQDSSGVQSLVGYVIATDKRSPVCPNELKAFVQKSLPSHMVPAVFVCMDAFPLTPNGKVDRTAFPSPDEFSKQSIADYVAPADDLEKIVAEIWKSVLERDQIGVNDNFFDLGGHSLLVIRVLTRLRAEVDPNVQVVDLFQYTTIKTLVEYLNGNKHKGAKDVGQDRAQARKASAGRRRRNVRTRS